jgi:hypothetical protein
MELGRLLIAIALFACSFGCNRGEPAKISPPDLQLVSAGNEPRRVLGYHAPKGTKQQLEIAVDVDVSAGEMGGPMPTIVMTLALEVQQIVPTGLKLRSMVVDATARDRDDTRVSTEALSGPLETLKGIVLTSTMTSNGRLFGTKLELDSKQVPESAKSQLAALTASFDQLMMPLPDEPVGVGAVWRSSKPLEQNGLKMIAVNSIALTAIDGNKLSFEIDTQVHGDDQTINQDGLTVDIKDVTGTGTGKGSIDLDTLALTSELATEFRSAMQAGGEGSATPMKMSIVTRVTPK